MERNKSTKNCKRISILASILVFIIFIIPNIFAIIPWADTSQLYRQEINITGATTEIDNLTHTFIIDSSNIGTNFNFTTHRDSLRFYYYNQTSNTNIPLIHYVKTWSNIDNNATIMVKIPYLNATTDANLFIYYGNTSKPNIEDYCSVFIYCDQFDDASINSKLTTVDLDTVAGTAFSEGSGVLTIIAGGADTWTGSDQYGSVYLDNIKGNVDIQLTVVSQTNSNNWAKAGIMIKNNLSSSGSSTGYSFNVRTPGNGYSFQRDLNNNGFLDTSTTAGSPSVSPSYLRLIKNGNTHLGYYSKTTPDTWTLISSSTITSTNSVQDIGISLTSHAGATLCTATFDDFIVRRYTTDTFSENFGIEEKIVNYIVSNLNQPSILITNNILQNNTFKVNISISCKGIDTSSSCQNVTGVLKYNNSGTFENIQTISNTPLWTTNLNPQSCEIAYNTSCDYIWNINATGLKDSLQNIYGYFYSNNTQIKTINSSLFNIKIVVGNTVNFNQSSFDFGTFTKNTGIRKINLSIISDNGNNTNIQVNCQSGDCLKITENWDDNTNLNQGQSKNIEFRCSDSLSGNYSATFNLTSSEYTGYSTIDIKCNVLPIYGPITAILNNPISNITTFVGQNKTFKLNATVNCNGICSNITANPILIKNDWWNLSWLYRQKLNISIIDAIPINYQILLKLNDSNLGSNFNWNNNCNDIRFLSDDNNNELNYWIESCNTTSKKISVWVKTDTALSASTNYILYLYYANNKADSNSNASLTFKTDQIHLTVGRCPSSDGACNYLDNFADGQTIRANINNLNWEIDGTSYVTSINLATNPFGNTDNYYMRFRSLFIPTTTGTYWFGTASDDGSNVGMWNEDGYGYGLSTPSSLTSSQDIITDWYGGHGTGTCGSSAAIERSRTLTANKGYWIDYVMQETAGGQDAKFCIDKGLGYINFGTTAFSGQIFARNYVENEPILNSISQQETILIDTNILSTPFYTTSSQTQSYIIEEDGTYSFEWLINATGLINTSWNVAVLFSSNISSIESVITNYTTINITDNIIPKITLLSPINNSKIITNETVNFIWKIEDDDTQINATIYINGISTLTKQCTTNINCSINLTLNPGIYNWSIFVNDSRGNEVYSNFYNFWNIQNYSSKITKDISTINTNLYNINITIKNNLNHTNNIIPIDFSNNDFSTGSFTPIYDWLNLTSGIYNGTIFGWDLTAISNSENILNYAINGNLDYQLSNQYIIGVD